MKISKLKAVFLMLFSISACSVTASETRSSKEYEAWLQVLKAEMSSRGISQKTLNEAFAKSYYHPQHTVIKKASRKYKEFIN